MHPFNFNRILEKPLIIDFSKTVSDNNLNISHSIGGPKASGGDSVIAKNTKEYYNIRRRLLQLFGHNMLKSIKLPNEGKGYNILEIGAGSGKSDKLFKSYFGSKTKVTCIDANAQSLEVYKRKVKGTNRDISFVHCAIEDILSDNIIRSQRYDLVIGKAVIHHLFPDVFDDLSAQAKHLMTDRGRMAFLNIFLDPKHVYDFGNHSLPLAVTFSIIEEVKKLQNKIPSLDINNIESIINHAEQINEEQEVNKLLAKIVKRTTTNSFDNAWKTFLGRNYSAEKRREIAKIMVDDFNIYSTRDALKTIYNLYSVLYTFHVNRPEQSIYTIQNREIYSNKIKEDYAEVAYIHSKFNHWVGMLFADMDKNKKINSFNISKYLVD